MTGEAIEKDEVAETLSADAAKDTAPVTEKVINGLAVPYGQTRLAEKLAHVGKGKLLFVHTIGWHYWEGTHWKRDIGEVMTRRLLKRVLQITVAHTDPKDEPLRWKQFVECYKSSGQNGALSIASRLEGVSATVDELDVDPYLLNTASGTLDLRTFELRPHDPADMLTKITGAAYEESVDRTDWDSFLAEVLPDREVREFLQRYVGYSLVGNVTLDKMVFLLGASGRNGKGTFYESLLNAMGTYGGSVKPELFLAQARTKSPDSPDPEKMTLWGRRVVACSESEENASLAAAQTKFLTGGDRIHARALYGKPVEFEPSHSFLFITNRLPKVSGSPDQALWSRLLVVPFNVRIPDEKLDPKLRERFKRDKELWSEILHWAVEGLKEFTIRGLEVPQAVAVASQDYETSSDAMRRFVSEALERQPGQFVTRTALWKAAVKFAHEENLPAFRKMAFYSAFEGLGFSVTKDSDGNRGYSGVNVIEDIEAAALADAAIIDMKEA